MKYRPKDEEQIYRDRDPIITFKPRVLAEALITAIELEEIEKRAVAEVDAAVQSAEEAPLPKAEEYLSGVYANYP
jgi:TPP-dependent pyruvate/acetoin dehydrogenase alpha subunit